MHLRVGLCPSPFAGLAHQHCKHHHQPHFHHQGPRNVAGFCLLLCIVCFLVVIMVAYHLHGKSGNSGRFVNGKRLYHRKITGKSGTTQKVIHFYRNGQKYRKIAYHLHKTDGMSSPRPRLNIFRYESNGTRSLPVIPSRGKNCLPLHILVYPELFSGISM